MSLDGLKESAYIRLGDRVNSAEEIDQFNQTFSPDGFVLGSQSDLQTAIESGEFDPGLPVSPDGNQVWMVYSHETPGIPELGVEGSLSAVAVGLEYDPSQDGYRLSDIEDFGDVSPSQEEGNEDEGELDLEDRLIGLIKEEGKYIGNDKYTLDRRHPEEDIFYHALLWDNPDEPGNKWIVLWEHQSEIKGRRIKRGTRVMRKLDGSYRGEYFEFNSTLYPINMESIKAAWKKRGKPLEDYLNIEKQIKGLDPGSEFRKIAQGILESVE